MGEREEEKSLALVILKIFHGVKNSKVGHVTLTTPLSGTVCYTGWDML